MVCPLVGLSGAMSVMNIYIAVTPVCKSGLKGSRKISPNPEPICAS